MRSVALLLVDVAEVHAS